MVPNRPQSWQNCDTDIREFIQEVVSSTATVLGEELTGVYLHGSLAMGSYYRPKSDIDLLVVVKSSLGTDSRKEIAELFASLAERRPTVGNLEASVVTNQAVKDFRHPCPFEVHYSSEWHEKIKQGTVDFSENNTDADLASHVLYVVKRGITLDGQEIEDVFSPISWSYFVASILDDFDWIVTDENILKTPFYSILNICRVIQTLSQKEQNVFSKDEGGEWGLRMVPAQYKESIEKALLVYRSSRELTYSQRRQGGVSWDKKQLLKLRDYARKEVENILKKPALSNIKKYVEVTNNDKN